MAERKAISAISALPSVVLEGFVISPQDSKDEKEQVYRVKQLGLKD